MDVKISVNQNNLVETRKKNDLHVKKHKLQIVNENCNCEYEKPDVDKLKKNGIETECNGNSLESDVQFPKVSDDHTLNVSAPVIMNKEKRKKYQLLRRKNGDDDIEIITNRSVFESNVNVDLKPVQITEMNLTAVEDVYPVFMLQIFQMKDFECQYYELNALRNIKRSNVSVSSTGEFLTHNF